MRSLHCGKVRCSYRMAKWGFDMINREEHKRLLDEIERLKAKNEELLAEMLMLRDMLVSVRSQKIARMYE